MARSYLFVPGDREDMLLKALHRGADALIVDLEDAVAPSAKLSARKTCAEWIEMHQGESTEIWVRVNSGALLSDDVAAMASLLIAGIVVPKVQSSNDLAALDSILSEIEPRWDGGKSRVLIPIIETASGLSAVEEIASFPRIHRLMCGEVDLGAELMIDPGSKAWIHIRSRLIVASAASGILSPIGPVYVNYRDLQGFEKQTLELSHLGFRSRGLIHPAQVEATNRIFTPTSSDFVWARRVVAVYEQAILDGRGSTTDRSGEMIDEAVVRRARRILDLY